MTAKFIISLGGALFCHVYLWITLQLNMVMGSQWQKQFITKYCLLFRFLSLQVSPSFPTWALLSPYKVSSWSPLQDPTQGFQEDWLLWTPVQYMQQTMLEMILLYCRNMKLELHLRLSRRRGVIHVSIASLHSQGSTHKSIHFCPCPF